MPFGVAAVYSVIVDDVVVSAIVRLRELRLVSRLSLLSFQS